jgi:hypothetical protein
MAFVETAVDCVVVIFVVAVAAVVSMKGDGDLDLAEQKLV